MCFTFDGAMRIRFVNEDEVDVAEVEVLKRLFDGLDDVLSIEAARFSTAAKTNNNESMLDSILEFALFLC